MKFVRTGIVCGLFLPSVSFGAGSNDFQTAASLLNAARRGDMQTVHSLVTSGANVNYVDATGLSLVCTAVMNNDKRAIQILQMYGADASNCDKQIKRYKQNSKLAAEGEEYGFFSGLSSSHVIALSAVGVAGVVGGVALLTNVLDGKGNQNNNDPSGGSHTPGGGGGGGSSGSSATKWAIGNIPDAPSSLSPTFNVNTALSDFVDANSADFNYLRTDAFINDGLNAYMQNYLLVMGGYYPLVNGYMGQATFRNATTNAPVLSNIPDSAGVPVQGRPVTVALVTGNGVNPAGSIDSADGIEYLTAVGNDGTNLTDKYLNNSLTKRAGELIESETMYSFDLSGSGSAFNPFASADENALAKIVAGWEAGGRSYGDLYGFVPNAQLAILRTGDGYFWQSVGAHADPVGTWTGSGTSLAVGDTITINGGTYTIQNALDSSVTNPTVTVGSKTYRLSSHSKLFLAVCDTNTSCTSDMAIYIGADDNDNNWYVNSLGGNDIDTVYSVANGNQIFVEKTKQQTNTYLNFDAMYSAKLSSEIDVIANTNILDVSRNLDYWTLNNFDIDLRNGGDVAEAYQLLINDYYGSGQGIKANNLFVRVSPMIIMPAGEYINNSGNIYSMDATFENYAPLIYSGTLNHNFMTVVAVGRADGTYEATDVADYETNTNSAFGKITLSSYEDSENNIYSARSCGLAGTGGNGTMDPWCFAAAGPTSEMATASAAGAVASIKSAFNYMTNDQVFTLLALTADGPFLATNTEDNNKVFTKETLRTYLDNMYDMPVSGAAAMTDDEYLQAFKEIYGYGLINLERAITPSKSIYYYTNGNIVSSSGNAYWRAATTNVHSSSALSLTSRQSIKTSYYDVVESIDGSMSLPRVWNDTFTFDSGSNHGLYMGDVLNDFNVDTTNKHQQRIGNMTFDMAMSQRAYNDSFNGLDNLRVAFSNNEFDIGTQYQHHFTDGESRFYGRANGLLNLVSNAVSSDANYKVGKFAFGGRAFFGDVTDETLMETDPVVSSQFEPGRLGFANGGEFKAGYNNDKFNLNMSMGVLSETNTVLGMLSDGLLNINGAETQYVDIVADYKPIDEIKLSLRGTFANTNAKPSGEIITELSNIKSNAFAFGADVGGFSFTASMPLAAVSGKMGYDYAEFSVAENDGKYELMMNNPHTEYINLSAQKREVRLSTSYKKPVGEFTDAGVGFIYRINPGNTDMFGNESVLMFKLHHRLGI